MKSIQSYKLLFSIALIGSIICFGRCVMMAFYSMGTSIGGHGDQAVIDAKEDSNQAELFFFLSMALLIAAVVLLYIINRKKQSGQIN